VPALHVRMPAVQRGRSLVIQGAWTSTVRRVA
jgi:hypothetical protein